MIVNTTRITLQPGKRTEFLQTVGPLLDPMKEAKGCRTLDCYLDVTDENSTLLVSEWETEEISTIISSQITSLYSEGL